MSELRQLRDTFPPNPGWSRFGVLLADGTACHEDVVVAAIDAALPGLPVVGGSAGETHSKKVVDMMESALKCGTPFVFINDSGGARVQEGIDSLSGYGKVFYENVLLSGVVPQVSIIAGPCAGGAVYSPALTDFIIQTRKAHMFITGPNVIKQVTGEDVTQDQLGGADAHMGISGVNHFVVDDDAQAILVAQKLLSYLPQNNTEDPPIIDPWVAVALWKERLQPLHLLVGQPEKVAHDHPRQFGSLNHASRAASSRSMGLEPRVQTH